MLGSFQQKVREFFNARNKQYVTVNSDLLRGETPRGLRPIKELSRD
jgi:hypothetical protein